MRRFERCVTCENLRLVKTCACLNPPKDLTAATGSCCGLYQPAPLLQRILGRVLAVVTDWFETYLLRKDELLPTKGGRS